MLGVTFLSERLGTGILRGGGAHLHYTPPRSILKPRDSKIRIAARNNFGDMVVFTKDVP